MCDENGITKKKMLLQKQDTELLHWERETDFQEFVNGRTGIDWNQTGNLDKYDLLSPPRGF